MAQVQFDAPDEQWFRRAEIIRRYRLRKADFYHRVEAGILPRGRRRHGLEGVWYTRKDVAYILYHYENQEVFVEPSEIPVKRNIEKKGGAPTGRRRGNPDVSEKTPESPL